MVTFEGVAFRGSSYDVPLWVSPNRRAGRFHRGPHQIAALDPEAPFADLLRAQGVRGQDAAAELVTSIWELRVSEGAIADLSTPELADSAGVPFEALVDDDWEQCQFEADRLKDLGARGLLSPSAALPGSVNLTLFGPRVAIDWNAGMQLASAIPARRLVTGAPPAGLLNRVRHFGDDFPLERALVRLREAAAARGG